jgi:hypothetical protein
MEWKKRSRNHMNCETIIKTCKICIMKIPEEKKETEEGI